MLPLVFIKPSLSAVESNKKCACRPDGVNNCTGMNNEMAKMADVAKDIEDIAEGTMKVMCICKLLPWEVRLTKDAIKRSFRHYEEIRRRVDRVPDKRFNKENFLHDLAVDAGMNRMDSQLAYGVVKRAFKAYYHGTGEGGKRLIVLAQRMRHRPECLWLHAARRTAQVYAVYAGLMYSEMKQYEECIMCVYKNLYEQLQTRVVYEDNPMGGCTCDVPEKKAYKKFPTGISNATSAISVNTALTTEIFFNKQTFNQSKATSTMTVQMAFALVAMESTLQTKASSQTAYLDKSRRAKKRKRRKCECPGMTCVKDRPPPRITAECSQGPFTCRWVSYEEEETFPEHRVPCPTMEEICPVCEHDGRVCAPDCTCTCEICTCPPAETAEGEHAEKLSESGLEDYDTDFCYLAPFRDWPRVDKVKKAKEATDEELGEEEYFDCRCTCEVKRRAFPHLFTYLMPFDAIRELPEPESVEEVIKTIKGPPVDISLATYRCWTEQQEVESEESSPCKQCPNLALKEWDAHGRYGPPPGSEEDFEHRGTRTKSSLNAGRHSSKAHRKTK